SRHFGDIQIEWTRLDAIVSYAFLAGAIAWLSYIALEPFARRFWPQLMIGWTRLLSGRLRDPQVGRDFLVGAAVGTIAALMIAGLEILPRLYGTNGTSFTLLPSSVFLLGTRYAIASAFDVVKPAFTNAIQCLAVFVILKVFIRRTWLV